MNRIQAIILTIVTCVCINSARAHEFWIQPQALTADVGSVLAVRLMNGERFLGEIVPRNRDAIEQFALIGDDTTTPVVGRHGAPTSLVRVESSGVQIIGFRSKRLPLKLAADEFEAYLEEEGLGSIITWRADHGESERTGREVYSRCAKALVRGSDAAVAVADAGYDRVLGYPLELVLESNPYARGEGAMTVRVLYDGEPLEDAHIVAVHREDPSVLHEARSDADGRATFEMDDPGAWMLTTIHMVRAPGNVDADWESFWASLVFEVERVEVPAGASRGVIESP